MTAQISPDEVTEFLDGNSDAVLRLSCPQPPFVIEFVRARPMCVSVRLPLDSPPRDTLFDIHKALAGPHWDGTHEIDADSIVLFSRDRSGLRQMIGIASLHLGWHNDDSITYTFVPGSDFRSGCGLQ